MDPSAHEAVLEWYTGFVDRVRNLGLPVLSGLDDDMLRDNRSWPADSHLESHFENWSWNRNDAARLAAIMEGERRSLYQAWKQQATTESLPDYPELWRRDRHVILGVAEVITKLLPMDRSVLENLLQGQPCKKKSLCHSVCGRVKNIPGSFNKSLTKITELNLVRPGGRGRSSRGYSLTDFGNEVVVVLKGLEPTGIGANRIHRHSDHG